MHGIKTGSNVIYKGHGCVVVFMTLNHLKVRLESGDIIKVTYNQIKLHEAKSN